MLIQSRTPSSFLMAWRASNRGISKNGKELPERFSYLVCILGSSWFISGRCYWETDVRTSREWGPGSLQRICSQTRRGQLSSELGFWTLSLRKGSYFEANTAPRTVLWVTPGVHDWAFFEIWKLEIFPFLTLAMEPIFSHSPKFLLQRLCAHSFHLQIQVRNSDQGALRIYPVLHPGSVIPPVHAREDQWNS